MYQKCDADFGRANYMTIRKSWDQPQAPLTPISFERSILGGLALIFSKNNSKGLKVQFLDKILYVNFQRENCRFEALKVFFEKKKRKLTPSKIEKYWGSITDTRSTGWLKNQLHVLKFKMTSPFYQIWCCGSQFLNGSTVTLHSRLLQNRLSPKFCTKMYNTQQESL